MNPIKKSIPYGRHTLTLETGEIARQAGGAVMVSLDDTVVLVTAVARKTAEGRPGLLSADGRLSGKDLRRGQDPRRLLQARRAPVGKGDADLASHRPSDPAAVPGWLLQRSPGHRDRDVGRSGNRSRHSRDDRRLGGADALRRAVQRPDRRRARRLHRRPVRAEPDQDRAHDLGAQSRRRRHRGRRADGRIRSERAARGSDAGRRRVRPSAAAGRDRAHPLARRGGRQAAVGLEAGRQGRGDDREGDGRRRRRAARGLSAALEAGATAAAEGHLRARSPRIAFRPMPHPDTRTR